MPNEIIPAPKQPRVSSPQLYKRSHAGGACSVTGAPTPALLFHFEACSQQAESSDMREDAAPTENYVSASLFILQTLGQRTCIKWTSIDRWFL